MAPLSLLSRYPSTRLCRSQTRPRRRRASRSYYYWYAVPTRGHCSWGGTLTRDRTGPSASTFPIRDSTLTSSCMQRGLVPRLWFLKCPGLHQAQNCQAHPPRADPSRCVRRTHFSIIKYQVTSSMAMKRRQLVQYTRTQTTYHSGVRSR